MGGGGISFSLKNISSFILAFFFLLLVFLFLSCCFRGVWGEGVGGEVNT